MNNGVGSTTKMKQRGRGGVGVVGEKPLGTKVCRKETELPVERRAQRQAHPKQKWWEKGKGQQGKNSFQARLFVFGGRKNMSQSALHNVIWVAGGVCVQRYYKYNVVGERGRRV